MGRLDEPYLGQRHGVDADVGERFSDLVALGRWQPYLYASHGITPPSVATTAL
jgi:hypothetical protein